MHGIVRCTSSKNCNYIDNSPAKNDNVIEITGKVKAKNSFNAYVVNKFLVVVDLKNNTYNLKGFE